MRLIDADKLKDFFYYGINDKPILGETDEFDRKVIDIINDFPTVREQLHGKWDTEFINDGFVGCPFCRTTHDIEGDFHLNDLHYCVNCGAKLD